jgi:hypothetical protein
LPKAADKLDLFFYFIPQIKVLTGRQIAGKGSVSLSECCSVCGPDTIMTQMGEKK